MYSTDHEDQPYHSAPSYIESNELIGALAIYDANIGKKRFKDIYHNNHEKRNRVTGTAIKYSFLIGVICFSLYLLSPFS